MRTWGKWFLFLSGIYGAAGFLKPHQINTEIGCLILAVVALFYWFMFDEYHPSDYSPKKTVPPDNYPLEFDISIDNDNDVGNGRYSNNGKGDVLFSGSKHIEFSYCNAKGEISRRQAVVKKATLSESGDVYLNAYCFVREEFRTFRSDRFVGDAVDLETGEVGDIEEILEI